LLRALRVYHENVSVAGVVVGELAWSGGPWLEVDLVSEITQASHEVGGGAARFERVEMGAAEVFVVGARREHSVSGNQDFVADGDGRAHLAAASAEAVVLVLEVSAALLGCSDSRSDQGSLEIDVALPGLAVPLLFRALVVARTDTCPCGEVGGTHEHAHIDADLGDDGGRDHPVDTGIFTSFLDCDRCRAAYSNATMRARGSPGDTGWYPQGGAGQTP
jgi:hypothetical protein